jgi:phage terminase large subunit-like protein
MVDRLIKLKTLHLTFLGIIYGADEDDDWTDPKVWAKANPNLGVSVRLEFLENECRTAKQIPSYENIFKRLYLNMWTEQDSRWIPIELWDSCKSDFEKEELIDKTCYIGIDLASTSDLTALVAVFPPCYQFEKFRVLAKFYLPQDAVEKRKKDRVHYDVWVKKGLIHVNEGNTTDYDYMLEDLERLWKIYNIGMVSVDKWNGAYFATKVQQMGLKVEFWGQDMQSQATPTRELEKLLLEKGIEHDGNEVLRWNAKNVAVRQDARGNLRPDKDKSKEKIDGIVALINGLGRALLEKGASIYETQGIRTT